jgi:hypothetical protein
MGINRTFKYLILILLIKMLTSFLLKIYDVTWESKALSFSFNKILRIRVFLLNIEGLIAHGISKKECYKCNEVHLSYYVFKKA